jgi:long-chain acyl-CoA synthetase
VKVIRILPEPFSIEKGELTPTLKLKRKPIAERYAAEIAAIYA